MLDFTHRYVSVMHAHVYNVIYIFCHENKYRLLYIYIYIYVCVCVCDYKVNELRLSLGMLVRPVHE